MNFSKSWDTRVWRNFVLMHLLFFWFWSKSFFFFWKEGRGITCEESWRQSTCSRLENYNADSKLISIFFEIDQWLQWFLRPFFFRDYFNEVIYCGLNSNSDVKNKIFTFSSDQKKVWILILCIHCYVLEKKLLIILVNISSQEYCIIVCDVSS